MPWTDDQIEQLRNSMANAKRAGAWVSALEAHIVIDLIQAYRRMAMRKGWAGPPEGRLPTIGDSRRHGIQAFFVDCANCRSRRRFTFTDLGLEDHVIFVEIPRHRRFRCIKCGRRQVSVMADWPSPTEARRREFFGNDNHRR